MDIQFFFGRRVAFIRQLYANGTSSFLERKRKIQAGEAPFEPPYSEDGEPPFIAEWIEADESLHVLGYTCLSMLAAALHLYFRTWEKKGGRISKEQFKSEFKEGWVSGYRTYWKTVFGIDLTEGPCDLKVIEEIVLARNRAQHPDNLVMTLPTYTSSDLRKLPRALFIDSNSEFFEELDDGERNWLVPPRLHVTPEKLDAVIVQVERFVEWLDPLVERAVYGGNMRTSSAEE